MVEVSWRALSVRMGLAVRGPIAEGVKMTLGVQPELVAIRGLVQCCCRREVGCVRAGELDAGDLESAGGGVLVSVMYCSAVGGVDAVRHESDESAETEMVGGEMAWIA